MSSLFFDPLQLTLVTGSQSMSTFLHETILDIPFTQKHDNILTKLIITCRFLNYSSLFKTQLYGAAHRDKNKTSYSDQPTISLYRASNMLSCTFWHGRTTSITKRGIKLTPMFVKLSFSDFLSAYSTGKFLCMMLFSVTL